MPGGRGGQAAAVEGPEAAGRRRQPIRRQPPQCFAGGVEQRPEQPVRQRRQREPRLTVLGGLDPGFVVGVAGGLDPGFVAGGLRLHVAGRLTGAHGFPRCARARAGP